MTSKDFTSIDVFCALEVGKSAHHGTALLRDGRITFDKPLPNGEPPLRELFARLGRKGKVPVVVDQPASIGTLAVTVARACGCEVAYLPGLSVRRLADLTADGRLHRRPALDGRAAVRGRGRPVPQPDLLLPEHPQAVLPRGCRVRCPRAAP